MFECGWLKKFSLIVFLIVPSLFFEINGFAKNRPQSATQLGFTYRQRSVPVSGKLVWMDEAALRRDFPGLKPMSTRQIKKLILKYFSVVTELQLSLRGTVIENFRAGRKFGTIYHPDAYIRAGYVEGPEFGLMDLKGTGYSPEGMERVQDLFSPIEKLKDEVAILDRDVSLVDSRRSAAEKRIKESVEYLEKERTNLRPSQIRSVEHGIVEDKKTAELFKFLKEVYEQRIAGKKVQQSDLDRYLELLGRRDYTNGSASLPRLLKEVIIQKLAQRVFDNYNRITGSKLRTIESYFLIELPYKVRTPGGKLVTAGVLGREAHWRFSNEKSLLIPDAVGVADLLSGVGDSGQFDVSGAMVDFENVEVRQAKELFRWNNGNQVLDQKIDVALTSWFRQSAVKDLISESLLLIKEDDFPDEKPSVLNDDDTFVLDFIDRVKRNESSLEDFDLIEKRELKGLLLSEIVQLSDSAPEQASVVILNFARLGIDLSGRFFTEVLFPIAIKKPMLFSEIIKELLALVPSDTYIPAVSSLALELLKRFSLGSDLHKIFWHGYQSYPFVYFSIWIVEELNGEIRKEVGESAHNFLIEEALKAIPPKYRAEVKNYFYKVRDIFIGGAPFDSSCAGSLFPSVYKDIDQMIDDQRKKKF